MSCSRCVSKLTPRGRGAKHPELPLQVVLPGNLPLSIVHQRAAELVILREPSTGVRMIPEVSEEIDRQLVEQRANAEAIATRAGLMIAATAALLGFSASTTAQVPQQPSIGYWLIGIALVVGVLIFWMARLGVGPTPSAIVQMQDASMLMNSKLILVEANASVLTRVQVVFSIQVGLTIAGVVILSLSLWPLP